MAARFTAGQTPSATGFDRRMALSRTSPAPASTDQSKSDKGSGTSDVDPAVDSFDGEEDAGVSTMVTPVVWDTSWGGEL